MLREKQFYKTFSVLALSLALHNLLSYSVNMMDMVMLGRYSQNAMSGVSLCNQVQFMLQMLVEGAGEGAVVLGAQYWGSILTHFDCYNAWFRKSTRGFDAGFAFAQQTL